LGGVGFLAISAATYLWVSARNDLSSLLAEPCAAARKCSASSVSSVRTRLIVGDILASAGVAAIGVGVWIWVARSQSATTAVTVTPAGALLRGTF
jgi:hypothetical protein